MIREVRLGYPADCGIVRSMPCAQLSISLAAVAAASEHKGVSVDVQQAQYVSRA